MIFCFNFLPCVVVEVVLVEVVLVEVEVSMVDVFVVGEEDDVGNAALI